MKIKEAVKQIGFRFSASLKKVKGTDKPPVLYLNEKDVNAIKRIDEYVSKKESEQFHDHELFAKLFIYLYMKILQNDSTHVLDPVPRRKIYNLLKKDLPSIIQEFTDTLNESEQYSLIESIQGNIKHPATLSDKERADNAGKLQEAIKEPKNKAKLFGEVWPYEDVVKILESEVNQAIEFCETQTPFNHGNK